MAKAKEANPPQTVDAKQSTSPPNTKEPSDAELEKVSRRALRKLIGQLAEAVIAGQKVARNTNAAEVTLLRDASRGDYSQCKHGRNAPVEPIARVVAPHERAARLLNELDDTSED